MSSEPERREKASIRLALLQMCSVEPDTINDLDQKEEGVGGSTMALLECFKSLDSGVTWRKLENGVSDQGRLLKKKSPDNRNLKESWTQLESSWS